jgi:hypothetical protein
VDSTIAPKSAAGQLFRKVLRLFASGDELFFLKIPRIEMRAAKAHPKTNQKGETLMKRYFASAAAVALLVNFASTAASAQKAALPRMGRFPVPLVGKLPLMGKLTGPLTGKLPQASLGKLMGNNPYAWMIHLNNVGNQNVANIYKACITHPGACNGLASQQSLNNAIQGVQNQSLINSQHQQVNQNIQTQAIGQTNCAVTGGTVYWNRNTQQKECSH